MKQSIHIYADSFLSCNNQDACVGKQLIDRVCFLSSVHSKLALVWDLRYSCLDREDAIVE